MTQKACLWDCTGAGDRRTARVHLLCSAVRGLQPNQQARGERKLGSSAACFFLFFFFFLYSLACAGLHLASKPKGLAQHVGGRPGRGAATPSPEHSPKSPGIPKVCCSAQRAEASLFSSPFLLWPQKKRKKKRGTNPAWYCRANHFGRALKALTAQLKKHNTSSQRRWVFFPHKMIR